MNPYPINIRIEEISDDRLVVISPSTGAPITLRGPFWAVSADLKQTLHKLETRSHNSPSTNHRPPDQGGE